MDLDLFGIILVFGPALAWAVYKIVKNGKVESKTRAVGQTNNPSASSALPEAVRVMLESQHQVIKDTVQLIENSNNLEVVVKRIDFLQDSLPEFERELEPYQGYETIKLVVGAYRKIFDDLANKEEMYIDRAIIRAFQAESKAASVLKTVRGKKERMNRFAYKLVQLVPEKSETITKYLESCIASIEKSADTNL